jgi:pSer/pThr/pTyr-binding forkhead associated (FHA) protein
MESRIMIELLYMKKDGTVRRFQVSNLPAVIGRIQRVPVSLPDPSVSREHARLFLRDGILHLADLNSSNGTFVNGKKVTSSPLRPGDEIRVGAAVLILAPDPDGRIRQVTPEHKAADAEVVEMRREPTLQVKPAPRVDDPAPLKREAIQFKERILQYNRIDARSERSFLKDDFAQYGGPIRLFALIALFALAIGSFFLFRWLGSEITPDRLGVDSGVQSVEEEE